MNSYQKVYNQSQSLPLKGVFFPQVTKTIYPKDILEDNTPFGTLARVAAYGRSQVLPENSMKSPIPRIAHYVCIDCEVRFITFLSMRSAVNVAGLNKVCDYS